MIRLRRSRDAATLGALTGAKLQQRLLKLEGYFYEDGGAVDFKPKARQIWSTAKTALKLDSAGKCAYCEADTAVVMTPVCLRVSSMVRSIPSRSLPSVWAAPFTTTWGV